VCVTGTQDNVCKPKAAYGKAREQSLLNGI